MEIELHRITVRELAAGYADNAEAGVVGYGGQLDIRPPYQREFVYKDAQRDAVIESVTKGFPLNVMYWAVREGGGYEIIDGQQRTISLCQYAKSLFSLKLFDSAQPRNFGNLQSDEQERILDYELTVYFCSGTDSEKLSWFRTINIAGEKLTEQELRNAVYSGSWVTDAKKYFSKTGCAASGLASKYLNGSPIRQEYLETAIAWISGDKVEGHMAAHQHDPNANALWLHFQAVINWVQATFPHYRKEMKGLDWGKLHREFGAQPHDSAALEKEITRLMMDDDVTKKSGIYSYVLTRQEKYLNIRAFSDSQKRAAYERQNGICAVCKKHFELEAMEADHITPWHQGGKTDPANCQLLCQEDNRRKSGR